MTAWLRNLILRLVTTAVDPEDRGPVTADLSDRYERLRRQGASDIGATWTYLIEGLGIVGWGALGWVRFHKARGQRGWREDITQDLRFSARFARANPGTSLVATATLAIGIGATVTLFGAVDTVLLQPLDLDEPDRLVLLNTSNRQTTYEALAQPNILDIREQSETLGDIAIWRGLSVTAADGGEQSWRLGAAFVTNNFFDVLREEPMRGRFFQDDEGISTVDPVVVLSSSAWEAYFGRDPDIVGTPVHIDGGRFTVIGIARAGFEDPIAPGLHHVTAVHMWFVQPMVSNENRSWRSFWAVGRLAEGATLGQAQAEVATIGASLQRAYPEANGDFIQSAVSLKERLVADARPVLHGLLVAVGMLLVIACANVANLLLSRSVGREREVAVRVAMGASRRRILQQLLTESAVLAVVAGAMGLGIALIGTEVLRAVAGDGVPRAEQLGLSGSVFAFSVAVSAATSLLFGLAPALRLARPQLARAVKDGAKGSDTKGTQRIRNGLVVLQLALSAVLLVASGLLVKSLVQMGRVDLGIERGALISFSASLPYDHYPEGVSFTDPFLRLRDSLAAVPGVLQAAGASDIPLTAADNSVWPTGATGPGLKRGTSPASCSVRSSETTPRQLGCP